MIVRTYGRRNRGITRTYSDTTFSDDAVDDGDDLFRDSLSQESPQDIYSIPFSSQDSSHWSSFDSEPYGSNLSRDPLAILPPLPPPPPPPRGDSVNGGVRKSKKARNGKRELQVGKNGKSLGSKGVVRTGSATATVLTTTLMETQEFGEMMEHVDEVNFALDGLRRGQQARIRRASLLSLLSISATPQQRRLLRTQGMAKTIIDAILDLSFDDSPSNLAAAALFYVLTSDGQDDHLLESPVCIRFLLKLLKPLISTSTKDKAPTIGCKLLALRRDANVLRDATKSFDSSSAAIALKVQEILVSCKELKSSIEDDNGMERPELSPKWIALLTMEKACLSTISLEDTFDTIRKSGGNFKEKLRELGGLNAVFDVAMDCHSVMEGWLEHSSPSTRESKDDVDLQTLVLLLKCLKIMENATFLSKDNQSHLLGMKGKSDCLGSPLSFTKLIISVIKILSGLSLLRSSAISNEKEAYNLSDETVHSSELPLMADCKVDSNGTSSIDSFKICRSTVRTSSEKSFSITQNSQWLPSAQPGYSISSSETTSPCMADTCLLKMRVSSSTSGSCSGTSRSSNSKTPVNNNGSRKKFGLGRRPHVAEDATFELLEDSQDPFAFDEDEFEPSKWDLLSGKQKVSRTQKRMETFREVEEGFHSQLMSLQESSNGEYQENQNSWLASIDEENANLIADCLLTAVKVLMNLTNDNPVGCQQIASCGGLETLSSLIAGHFPLFSSSSSPFSEIKDNTLLSQSSIELDPQNDRHLNDQELEFLVAILGLLVNLVEKDGRNRSRLAETSVPLPNLEGVEGESRTDLIPLLCSIFLANKGAGEAAGEEKLLPLNDEAAVLQGEREAEKMIIEAYAALLLAFLSTESKSIRDAIADCLPDHNLAILVPVLERFVAFHLTLDMISPETHKAVSEVIESCRIR
ncbi:hypothetical protein L1049_010536 [Liquidambar formosana]|uniref:Wings apart-like protein C-terminal domain-containing protein n=1 Tax=Liquidambar formosana TaxID=63359 RepID=A0AAP0N7R1_LIQFO